MVQEGRDSIVAKWLERIEKAIGGGPGGPKRVRSLRLLLIIGGVGAALMLLNSFLPFKPVERYAEQETVPPETSEAWSKQDTSGSMFEAYEHPIENRLKDILEQIVGVGKVDVLVTIDSTEEIVIASAISESQQITDENTGNGGRRHITSVTKNGQIVLHEVSGDSKPIVTKTINPRIRGILIVASGAENATVRKLITQAVERGVNIAVNRISVVPRKQ